ncbi:MAG: hypothetical protein ACK4EY_03395 [Flavipsychrobacter sp.]
MKQLFFYTVLCIIGCKFSLKAQTSQQDKLVLSVIVKVASTTDSNFSFQLLNTIKARGYIKHNSPGLFSGTDWEVRFTDAEGKLLQLNKVDDPTHTVVECLNDEGHYQQVEVSNNDGVLWLRANYTDAIKYVAIYNGDQLLQKIQLQ